MEHIDKILAALAALVGAVWLSSAFFAAVLTKMTPKTVEIEKDVVAFFLGPLAALVAHGLGWLPLAEGAWGWAASIVFGLIATGLAGLGHDKLVKPAKKLAGKPKKKNL